MDETWVYTYDPESKLQSAEWLAVGEPRPVKELQGIGRAKCMLVSFFDFKGLIYHEFVRNRTVNTELFVRILGQLRLALDNRRPHLRHPVLHMDNASPHTARDTCLKLLFTGIRTMDHPPYSPDLAPSDYWFFSRVKQGIKGRTFRNLDALEDAVLDEIAQIPSAEYADCILNKWPKRWARCVFRAGDYFEGQ